MQVAKSAWSVGQETALRSVHRVDAIARYRSLYSVSGAMNVHRGKPAG